MTDVAVVGSAERCFPRRRESLLCRCHSRAGGNPMMIRTFLLGIPAYAGMTGSNNLNCTGERDKNKSYNGKNSTNRHL